MARVKTFINGGLVLPGDLNGIQDDYEGLFSGWKRAAIRWAPTVGGAAAATYALNDGGENAATPVPESGFTHPGAYRSLIFVNPSWFPAGSRTVKARLVCALSVGSTAPGANFTFALQAPATYASGSPTYIATLSAAVSGSSVLFTAPGANTQPMQASAEFNMTANRYAITVAVSGAAATPVIAFAELQYRQV